MQAELIGGPGDGRFVDLDEPPQPEIDVPLGPGVPSLRPWDIHQEFPDGIPAAAYRLTVRPSLLGPLWCYVYIEQYAALTRRWR